jgi:hypothetical protein
VKERGIFMRKVSVIITLFPALFMNIIAIVSFSNMSNFNSIDFKGIFILSLILLFPLLFLIQGIICARYNINAFISLGASILGFIILMLVYLNDSAVIYIFTYLIFGIMGYLITKICRKLSKK